MLTMLMILVLAAGFFRMIGFGVRIFGKMLGWLLGGAVVIALLGTAFAVAGLMFRLLPVIALIGIGILIGRRPGGGDRIERSRDYDRIVDR